MESVIGKILSGTAEGFAKGSSRLCVCSLTDDLALSAESEDSLRSLVPAAEGAASDIGPLFRKEKCSVVACSCRQAVPAKTMLQRRLIEELPVDSRVL